MSYLSYKNEPWNEYFVVFFPHRCDFNKFNIRYAVALSKQRGMKRAAEDDGGEEDEEEEEEDEELSEEMSEASLDVADMIL